MTDDLALMIEELDLGPTCFIGQSQGGMIGLRLAARWPGLVSGLVLIGTSARAEYPDRLDQWRSIQRVLLDGSESQREATFVAIQTRLNGAAWLEKEEATARHERSIMFTHERKGITLAINAASLERTDVRQLRPAISAPTLVICGTADRATPVELSEEIAAGIRGAQL
jgi:3-oxoadipate enol-lactonase